MTVAAIDRPANAPAISPRLRSAIRATVTLIGFGLVYEAIAATGYFPQVLMPSLIKIGVTLWTVLLDGTMLAHAASTLYRVLIGMGLAVVVGMPLGILMGRYKPV